MDNLTATFAVVLQVVLTLPMLWMAGAPVDWSIFLSAAGYFISRTVIAHYGTWANSDHLIGAFTAAQFIGSVVGSGLSVAALMVLGPNPSVALGAEAWVSFWASSRCSTGLISVFGLDAWIGPSSRMPCGMGCL